MKIVSLRAENVKRLHAVEIHPSGHIVEVTGRNRQGKSSTIDSIWYALGGKREIPASPIRRGETEASIELDLGDYKVTRTFNYQDDGSYTTYLTLKNRDGATFSKAQDMLNAMVGELASDPVEFLDMKEDDQIAILKRFVPDFDFAANATAHKRDFDKRTEVNRQLKELRAQASAIQLPEQVPAAAVDTADILEKLRTAGTTNQGLEQERARRLQQAAEIERIETEAARSFAAADEARRQARKLDDEATRLTEQATTMRGIMAALEPVGEPVDTAALTAQLQEAQQTNTAFATAKRRKDLEADAQQKQQEADALTAALAGHEDTRSKAIASSKLPVPGLGFDDTGVTLNGLPFNQASGAEQLRTSLAIAAALNPKLRVILVRDGTKLDREAMQLLSDYAVEKDLQVWIETVESSRPSAIVIEDGRVVEPMLHAAE